MIELWPLWTRLITAALLSVAIVVVATRHAPSTRVESFLRTTLQVGGVLLLLLSAFCIWNDGVDAALPPQRSPNGEYTARVVFSPDVLDQTTVLLHRTGSWRTEIVYAGRGWEPGGGEGSPYAEWQDNTHLHIGIHGPQSDLAACRHPPGPITIVCTANDW